MQLNALGFVRFMASLGAGYGIAEADGDRSEGLAMMFASPLLALADGGRRQVRRVPAFGSHGAGSILWLPAWLWGVFWTVLGGVYYRMAA